MLKCIYSCLNGNFFVLNVGGYAKKCAIFSQISTAKAPLTYLFELTDDIKINQ